ncbi:MAG: NUDIX hydrolase [Microthrixaceae bacterium]
MAEPGTTDEPRGGPQFIPRPAAWRPGRDAPWSTVVGDHPPALDLDDVRRVFPPDRRGMRSPVADTGAAPSAVLVAFYMGTGGSEPVLGGGSGGEEPLADPPPHGDMTTGSLPSGQALVGESRSGERLAVEPGAEELYVILTRRSWGLRTHAGEVAFPGGRCELGESTAEAAVREAWEETSLDPDSVELLGELDHLTTVTRRAYIVPQVAVLAGRPELRANPGEVDRVLMVPVSELLDPEIFSEEQWGDGPRGHPVYFFALRGDTIWGATAAMLRQCLSLLVGADPGPLEDLDPARTMPPGYRVEADYEGRVV